MKKLFSSLAVCLTLVGALLFNLLSPISVFAEAPAVKISPVANAIQVKAGQTQNYQFTLENVSSKDYSFKLYTAPYNVTNEDYDADFTNETSYNMIMRWITFEDETGSFVKNPVYKIKAGEKRTIIYRVTVPDDIPEGGQYCIIFAESIDDETFTESGTSAGVGSVSRVSLIILGHGDGETRDTAEITDFNLTGMFTASDINAMAKVKNTGNTDFLAVYDMSVKSIFGTPIYSNSDNFIVLPGTERKFTTSWAEAPLFGVFNVSFSVSAIDVAKTESHVILILPGFIVVIALLLLTSIFVWTIILIRKRKERSSRLVV
ncbi:hypothetical protein IKE71_00975 [Candidatus Saccharibacteria bacterium]|nr:hypothetical protein [Candidatus Saccharibacteria bacterium]